MKTSAILVGSSAALAATQATFPAGFPECGQVCITNMLNLANNFGCGIDPVCLCTRRDFLYGIRDCSNEYCQNPSAAAQAINYGAQFCADAGIAISGLPGNTASATVPASTTVLATASTTGPATGAGSTGPEGVTSGVAVATSEILSTLTEGDSVITTAVGSTTIYSTLEPSITGTSSSGSAVSTTTETSVVTTTSGSATESESNTPSTVVSSTISSIVSSTISSVVSSTVALTSSDVTITTTNSEGQTETNTVPTTVPVSEEGAGATTEPGNLAAQHTAGPVAILAAAGMAAALLL